MTNQNPNWLSTQDFARRIGASVEFVRRRVEAGVIPHQRAENNGSRLISLCHIGKFKPYSDGAQIFSVEEVTARTGLSKQTVCDLLKKGEVRYVFSDGHGQHAMKTLPLEAARPVKHWLIPAATMAAFVAGVRPNREGWPTAQDVAQRIGASTSYVLRRFKTGRICGQQSIIRQRIHIHPTDVAQFRHDDQYNIPISHVSAVTGLAVQTISGIVRRGHFTQRHSDGCRGIATDRKRISARKRLKRYWFTEAGLNAILQGVSPYLMHWPTAKAIEERFDLASGTVSFHFNKGQIRGCTSIKGQGQNLYIHPSELRKFLLQKNYSVDASAKRLSITGATLRKWNVETPAPFLRHTLGNHVYVPPHLLGRMQILKEHNVLSRRNLQILGGTYVDFKQALLKKAFNTLCYDPDHPPSILECKKGMLVIFPDGESGLIRQTRQDAYQPAIEVFRKDEQESYLYAAAR
jgi:hypothetical protein